MTTAKAQRDKISKPDVVLSDLPVPTALFSSRRLLECNPFFAEVFIPPGEGGGAGGISLAAFAGEQNAALAKELARLVNSSDPVHSPLVREVALHTREGERRFLLSALPSTHATRRAIRIVLQDITSYGDRARRAEEAEARYRIFVETSAAAIALVRDGLFVYVNKGMLDLLGYMFSEEIVSREITQFFAGRDRKLLAEFGRTGGDRAKLPPFVESSATRKDGSRVRLQLHAELITVEDQPTLLWHCLDVSRWRDTEAAIEQKSRENETLEHLLDAVHGSVDRSEVQRATLAASLRWLGYECGGLFMAAEDGKVFRLDVQERLPSLLAEKLRELPAGEGLMGYITKTMEPVRVAIEEYPAHLPYRSLFEGEGVRALAFLPLAIGEKPAGVLMLLATRAHEVHALHQDFLQVVSRHLGFSLHKAVHYEAIQRRADEYQEAVEEVAGAVYVAAPNGVLRYCSPVLERLTGYKIREITATPDAWRAMVHPDDRPIAAERISRQAGSQNEFVLEYRVLPKGKASYIRVRDAVRYRRASDGTVESLYGLVTEIKGQEVASPARPIPHTSGTSEDLERENRELTLLKEIASGLAGSLDWQSALEVIHALLAVYLRIDAFGYDALTTPPDVTRRVYGSCGELPPESSEPLAHTEGVLPDGHPFRALLAQRESYLGGTSLFSSVLAVAVVANDATDGVLWVARREGEPFSASDLRLVKTIANLVEIALDRIRLIEQTTTHVRDLVARNDSLNHFAYVVSHDLKEPLITIAGYTKLVLDGGNIELDPESREHLGAVMRSSVRMQQLIDDLLTMSRIGRAPGNQHVIPVSPLLDDLTRDLEFFLQERGARVEYPPDLPAVRYDMTELGIVFRNLIVNGVRYNIRETPVVSVSAKEGEGFVTYLVTDNGIGIDPADHDRVFEIFQRLHPADDQPGTGAGLAIVRKIVESFRGKIWLASTPGAGSTFFFTVPTHG